MLYSLKHSGYIKETSPSVYTATKKLKTHLQKTEGIHIGTSGSKEHALAVRNSLQLIPKEALLQHRFKTSEDIIKEFKHKNLRSVSYNKALHSLISEKKEQLEYLKNSHLAYMPKSECDRYEELIKYKKDKETIQSQISILESDKPYLTPDYQITFTSEQFNRYIDNYTEYIQGIPRNTNAYELCMESLKTMYSLQSQGLEEITINIEQITNKYGNREIQMHKNYSVLTGQNQIFII